MEKIIIIGSGFSALVAYLKFKKYNPIVISSSNYPYIDTNFKQRKNLNINKFFATKSNSQGNIIYELNNNTQIHDRLSLGGNTNLWGGFINTQNLPVNFLEIANKNHINFIKLNIKENGYSSNQKQIKQLRDYKNNILNSSLFFENLIEGFVYSLQVNNNKIKVNFFKFKKQKFETFYANKIFLAISFPQIIDLFFRSNFIYKDIFITLSEYGHRYKKTLRKDFKKYNSKKNIVIKYDLIRTFKHFFGFQKSVDNIKLKIPIFVDQIFSFEKRLLELKLNFDSKKIIETSGNKFFGDSIHYCNLKINDNNIDNYVKEISNNIIGISVPFVNQKNPGPISNDIINNFWYKYD